MELLEASARLCHSENTMIDFGQTEGILTGSPSADRLGRLSEWEK